MLAAKLGAAVTAGTALIGSLSVASLLMAATGASTGQATGTPGTSCEVASAGGGDAATLDASQLANAQTTIEVGRAQAVPTRGWTIAIATALQESGLRNLPYGDRDSRGLFQQRPSQGWGSLAQVSDPAYAAGQFFAHLVQVPGWQRLPLTFVAQAVQHSAFPLAYATQEAEAATIIQRLTGQAASGCLPLASGPWTLPVASGAYHLTSPFGERISPTTGAPDFHTGLDFAAPLGTPVMAAASGVVEWTGWAGGYGDLVKLRHSDGVETYYAHLSAITANVGTTVAAGTEIGRVGTTGNSTGPHMHFEVRVNGTPTDPATWLQQRGLTP